MPNNEDSESEDDEGKKLNPKIKVSAGIRSAEEIKAAAADVKKVSNNKIGKDGKVNEAASGSNGNQKHLKKMKEELKAREARENLEKQQAAALAMQQAAEAAMLGKK